METEIKRGEMYWMQSEGFGVEQKLGRPIVIVSANKGNEMAQHVIGLFCTTSVRTGFLNVEVNTPRKRTWVQCNYPITAYKERLGNYMYTLTDEEMAAVDKAMRVALALGEATAADFEEERRSYEEEIEQLNSRISSQKDSGVEIRVERDMYKRMYEKAVEMLAAAKMQPKVEKEVVEKAPVVVEKPPVVEPPVEEKLVELNTCTGLDLRRIGCTPTMIRSIMTNRPYTSVEDLRKVPQITNVGYGLLKNRVCCVPVVEEKKIVSTGKLNVNTATSEDFIKLGIGEQTSMMIVRYRDKNGMFNSVEDLLKVPRFGSRCMALFGPRMEV